MFNNTEEKRISFNKFCKEKRKEIVSVKDKKTIWEKIKLKINKKTKGFSLMEMLFVVMIVGIGTLIVSEAASGFINMFLKVNDSSTIQHQIVSLGNFQTYSNNFFKGCDKIKKEDGTLDDTEIRCYNKDDKNFYRVKIKNHNQKYFLSLYNDDKTRELNIFTGKKKVVEKKEFKTLSNIYKIFVLDINLDTTNQKIFYTVKN